MMCEQSTNHPFETFFAAGHTHAFFLNLGNSSVIFTDTYQGEEVQEVRG